MFGLMMFGDLPFAIYGESIQSSIVWKIQCPAVDVWVVQTPESRTIQRC